MSSFLPYGRQLIEDDDIAAVAEVLRGDWLTTGPSVTRFEEALAARVGAPHAVSCSSATAGLHLACMAAGIGPGDTAVVPAVTFVATANAVRYVGGEVMFADVDPDTGLMRPDDLTRALARAGGAVKAVLPVHMAGQCEDMTAISRITREAGAVLIEDACHALGATAGNAPIGACAQSDMSVFSFHPVKTLAMGEGGAVTTRDPVLAERLARFRSHGLVRDLARMENLGLASAADGSANPWYYEMPEPGFNYRASDIQCALGLSQLGKLDRFVEARRRLADHYEAQLAPLAPMVRPLRRTGFSNPAWHLQVVLIDFQGIGMDRAALMRALHAQGIGSQVHYLPVARQPYYERLYGKPELPGADAYYARCLSLPLFAGMTEAHVERVVATLQKEIEN
ncbi:UDP-4-amino-4,6-dideoxy-N-acetyl-beta-L-altrosamine transaminase [Agaricicola taiwanensis]|uniref:UDP-4-amino-4,6-dideoxy-N-acetyl-beta-L-altrosamine transaminase n=1 Tax=Agaricicola taiwanensis TaxID=591372 RepID=A0A8J2VQI7_9RHOB|nr:UDP-4-amino-4,6-dideoxy-N-acetyl-beta-L-altrosamine transaminase [Agaricicola taiwanensis]GGE35144.1 UDP-4-amino-4,6-dideoxy-N-acetyl-beta-L-altrosamine transaminase [Agaricicola taiwanensis]